MGADLLGTLPLSIVVILAAGERDRIHTHVAVGLAALGLIGPIARAKCVADEQAF